MRQEYGVNISYEKAWRARENAYASVRGSPEESYSLLERYGKALRLKNPGLIYHIELEDERCFKYFFMALGSSLRGFAHCAWPIIAVDGTFLKAKFYGVLLIAIALDRNENIYPLCFAIVDRESDASWTWFFHKLKEAIGEVKDLVVVSDSNNSISKACEIVYPSAFHGFCTYHLRLNLSAKFRNEGAMSLYSNVIQVYRESEFNDYWTCMSAFPGPRKYLEEAGIQQWSRALAPKRRYNVMTTNIVECMNSILRDAKELPVLGLIEYIRTLVQRWFYERRMKATDWTSILSQHGEEIIQENQKKSITMKVEPIEYFQFYVKDGKKDGLVNLNTPECSYRKFDMQQIPCPHALAVARERNIDPYTLCSLFYRMGSVIAAYAKAINPVGHISEWQIGDTFMAREMCPPKIVKRIGRRRKSRIRSMGEHSETCKRGRCGGSGHNRKTCQNPIAYDK